MLIQCGLSGVAVSATSLYACCLNQNILENGVADVKRLFLHELMILAVTVEGAFKIAPVFRRHVLIEGCYGKKPV